MIGKEGGGVYVMMSGLDIERAFLAAGPLGWATHYSLYSITIIVLNFTLDLYICFVHSEIYQPSWDI